MRRYGLWLVIVAAMMTTGATTGSGAGPLRVYCTGAVQGIMEQLTADLTQGAGMPLQFTFGTAGAIRDRVQAGELADVVIASDAAITQLAQGGILLPDRRVVVGTVVLGVAARDGVAPLIDLGTPEAFARLLVGARSVAHADPSCGATAGIYLAGLIQKLGIAPDLAGKTVLAANGRDVAQRVASGQAELGITFISEIIPVGGVHVAALLPEGLQNPTTYVAGIPSRTADRTAAEAFLRTLASPATRARLKAAGFTENTPP